MKRFYNNTIVVILAVSLALVALGLTGPSAARAATTPSLGAAASYGVLAGTYTNSSAATTINGDVGFTTGPAQAPLGTHPNYGSGDPTPTARTDAANALSTGLATQGCTFTFPVPIVDLSTDGGFGGVYTPGVYCSTGAMNIGVGGITLNGSGTYIFRAVGALTSTAGAVVTSSGASACDVFWTPTAATTLAANTTFLGTIIDNANAITVGANTVWTGRALSLGAGTVTTGSTDTITAPTCATPSVTATLHVVKHVINDNGGTATSPAFTLNVSGTTNISPSSFAGSEAGVDVTLDAGSYAVTEPVVPAGYLESGSGGCSGSITAGQTKTCTITNDDIAPQLIVNKVVINDNGGIKVISDFPLFIDGNNVISGVASTTTIGLHTVSETADPGYAGTIGGNCAAGGTITLALGDVKTCTITNDDIAPVVVVPSSGGGGGGSYFAPVPPLIDVVKVPDPLALPSGPGLVRYTYTLRNIGTVPVSNITMVGDTCSPIVLVSGDTNNDAKLDVNETWVYTCSTMLSKTHTNIVTATGWANGISATDIANATVIVGIPVVPPLIHVTKVPSPLLLSTKGGTVTYTNKVTNPGMVGLSNVSLTDDKCGPVQYVSGDTKGDSKLEPGETWTYTCRTKLTKTTTNTVTASGEANGLTATDFAIATVVLSGLPNTPIFPNTGLLPEGKSIPWNIVMLLGIFTVSLFLYSIRKRKTA